MENSTNAKKKSAPKSRAGSTIRDSQEATSNPTVPDFCAEAVFGNEIKLIKLSDYKRKYLVLIFYSMDFSSVCPNELAAFSQRIEDFKCINCEVLACSTDSIQSHLNWICTSTDEGGLGMINFPLLSDKNHQISKLYGVLNEKEGIPYRALFIIDDNQMLRQVIINDMKVERSVDQILHLVQAYQHNDRTAEVCPVNWQPGDHGLEQNLKRKPSTNWNETESKRNRT